MMKLHDQHMHSIFSKDSQTELIEYYKKAYDENIKYVATCEHFDYCTTVDGTTWMCDYDSLIKEQNRMKELFPSITPLLGIELGFRSDCLNEIFEIKNKYDYDIIQLSFHDNGKRDYYFINAFNNGIDYTMNEYFDFVLEGLDKFNDFDVLSHIDFAFKTALQIDNNISILDYKDYLIKIFDKIIENNKALEINCKVQETIDKIYKSNEYNHNHLRRLLRLYKERNGNKLTLSSDAHTIDKYRLNFDEYQKVIKEEGFDYLLYYIKRKEYKYYL